MKFIRNFIMALNEFGHSPYNESIYNMINKILKNYDILSRMEISVSTDIVLGFYGYVKDISMDIFI